MIASTELILNPDGSVYHLCLLPEEVAHKVIFVGDPERIPGVTRHFDSIEMQKSKREFHTATGYFKGQRMTVLSTGIGTDNIDIVLNELDALVNIDLKSRTINENKVKLKIMRLGTCGGLQPENMPGTIVRSRFSVGMDGLLDYYQGGRLEELEMRFRQYLSGIENMDFPFYAVKDAESVNEIFQKYPEIKQGITFTAKGFYGPQGRSLGRLTVTNPQIIDVFSGFSFYHIYKALNLEMETAGILGLGGLLGHECVSLSVILANRPKGVFAENPAQCVETLIEKGLEIMEQW